MPDAFIMGAGVAPPEGGPYDGSVAGEANVTNDNRI